MKYIASFLFIEIRQWQTQQMIIQILPYVSHHSTPYICKVVKCKKQKDVLKEEHDYYTNRKVD